MGKRARGERNVVHKQVTRAYPTTRAVRSILIECASMDYDGQRVGGTCVNMLITSENVDETGVGKWIWSARTKKSAPVTPIANKNWVNECGNCRLPGVHCQVFRQVLLWYSRFREAEVVNNYHPQPCPGSGQQHVAPMHQESLLGIK